MAYNVDAIFSDPLYAAIITVVLALIGILGRQYLGPEDDWIELKKQNLFKRLDPFTSKMGYPLLRQKRVNEYVCSTVELDPDAVEVTLHDCDYEENDISNAKYRILPDGTREWNVGQLAYSVEGTDKQWHAYLFPGHGTYGCDIYQHGEVDWDPSQGGDPEGHLTTPFNARGDPEEILELCFRTHEVEFERDEVFIEEMKQADN